MEEHTIVQGQDYTLSTYNMQITLHGRAKAKGLRVASRSIRIPYLTDEGVTMIREGLKFKFEEPEHAQR